MRTASKAAMAAGVGFGVAVTRRMLGDRSATRGRSDHWLAVTVNRAPEEVGPVESLPEPLAGLRSGIELRIRPAAGDKGTELLARPSGGEVSREELRAALRAAKSVLETGEVLQADARPSTHPGPAGKVLQAIVGRSRGEGRL